ncbi:hypothetical protein ACHQM5_029601 [Ranunculus cassubicifolius]
MLHSSQSPISKPSTLLIRSSIQNKIFEDHSTGIVCYKTESGEIICEGYDEGPRYQHRLIANKTYYQREFQVTDVQQKWYLFIQENELNVVDHKAVEVIEELDSIIEDTVN